MKKFFEIFIIGIGVLCICSCTPSGEPPSTTTPVIGGGTATTAPSPSPSPAPTVPPVYSFSIRSFQTPLKLQKGDPKFGISSLVVGDVDGDGKKDIAVSDPDFSAYKTDGKLMINSATERGKVYIYFGNSLANKTTPDIIFTNKFSLSGTTGNAVSLTIGKYTSHLGSCSTCEDLFIGDYETSWDWSALGGIGIFSGGVYIYRGERLKDLTQNQAKADLSIVPIQNLSNVSGCLTNYLPEKLGNGIILSDIDRNTKNNLLINDLRSPGKVYLFDENKLNLVTSYINHCESNGAAMPAVIGPIYSLGRVEEGVETIGVSDPSQGKLKLYRGVGRENLTLTAEAQGVSGAFPHTVVSAGNLNPPQGGSEDILVSQISGDGIVNVFYGFPRQSSSTSTLGPVQLISFVRFNGQPQSQFGSDLAVADLNQDTFLDILIGAPGLKKVFIFYGKIDSLGKHRWERPSVGQSAVFDTTSADQILEELQEGFGTRVKVGDVNGDGKPDIIVGASGVIYVYE